MTTILEIEVSAEKLTERQRLFLERLRQHDKRVKVVRAGPMMVFHGPIIGLGPMPEEEPGVTEPDDEL